MPERQGLIVAIPRELGGLEEIYIIFSVNAGVQKTVPIRFKRGRGR